MILASLSTIDCFPDPVVFTVLTFFFWFEIPVFEILFFFTSFRTVLILPCPIVSREEEGSAVEVEVEIEADTDDMSTSATAVVLKLVVNCTPCGSLGVASGNCCCSNCDCNCWGGSNSNSGLPGLGRRKDVLLELKVIKDCGPLIRSFNDDGRPGSFKSRIDSLLLGPEPEGMLKELYGTKGLPC